MSALSTTRQWWLVSLAVFLVFSAPVLPVDQIGGITPFADEAALIDQINTVTPREAQRLTAKLGAVRFQHAKRLSAVAIRDSDERYLRLALLYAESSTLLAPNQAEHWALLGSLYAGMGELAIARLQAEQALLKALEINPELRRSRYLLARLLLVRGSYHRAIQHLQQLNDRHPDSQLPAEIAAAYMADQHFQPGVDYLQALLKKNPEARGVQVPLAMLLHSQGNTQQALEHVRAELADEQALHRQLAVQLLLEWKLREDR